MKSSMILIVAAMLTSSVGQAIETDADRKARQAELDGICELERQKKLAIVRAGLVEECVEKKQRPDRAACERFYKDYGERTGSQEALFYDLPACVEAFEHQRSYRS